MFRFNFFLVINYYKLNFEMYSRKKNAVIIFSGFLSLVIGIFLIFYQINFENYWIDEIASYWQADPKLSLKETLARNAEVDGKPVLQYIFLLKIFFKFLNYDPNLGRYLSSLFGILSLFSIFFLSFQINKSLKEAIFCLVLISLNIYLIKYSQELRPYTYILFLCLLNIIFFFKIIEKNLLIKNKIIYSFFFILFSLLSMSSHPFVLLIFFTQIIYVLYNFYFHKDKSVLFFILLPIICFLYLYFNYDFIMQNIKGEDETNLWITSLSNKFYYDYFFSRFFGSKIMGTIYLITLIYLIIKLKNKIFSKSSKLSFFVFLIIISYLVPITYGVVFRPLLTDRYIIFVLIGIFCLISSLALTLKSKKIKYSILFLLIFSTLINLFIEIKFRVNAKPEFVKTINYIKSEKINNVAIIAGDTTTFDLIKNYLKDINNTLKYFELKNNFESKNKFFILCYEPLVGYNCNFKKYEKNKYNVLELRNFYLIKLAKVEIIN